MRIDVCKCAKLKKCFMLVTLPDFNAVEGWQTQASCAMLKMVGTLAAPPH